MTKLQLDNFGSGFIWLSGRCIYRVISLLLCGFVPFLFILGYKLRFVRCGFVAVGDFIRISRERDIDFGEGVGI